MQFITILAGHQFTKPEAKVALAEAKLGGEHRLFLRRNPSNAYDANAIEVWLSNVDGSEYMIGHVSAATAADLAPYMDNDQEARENEGNPLWTEDHTPTVDRVEILDYVAGDKKPTIVIEVSTGYELGTLVKSPRDADEDGDEDYLVGDEDETDDDEE